MFFEEIKTEAGKIIHPIILPDVSVNNKKRTICAFVAPFCCGIILKDKDFRPIIYQKIFRRNFAFSPDYKTIRINKTRYDVDEFYNKKMIAKKDKKTISMIVLQVLYDEIWREVIACAISRGAERKP